MKTNKFTYCKICSIFLSLAMFNAIAYANVREEKELDTAREELEMLEEKIGKFNRLDGLKGDLEAIKQKEAALTVELDSRKKHLSDLQAEKALAQAMVEREKAVGEHVKSLKLVSGKTYEDVEIRKVSDVGITILHSSGSARIEAKDLPAGFRERFRFDSERAAEILKGENEVASTHYTRTALDADTNPISEIASHAVSPEISGKEEENAVPKGRLTARIIGYKKGHKQVEFTAFTNCDAKVTVYGAIEYPPDYIYSFSTTSGAKTIRNVKVRNDYRANLTSSSGKLLDGERSRQKSGLGKPRLGD